MTKEEKNAEILRLVPYATKYVEDVLQKWNGALPATITKEDIRQHALLVVCEHVEHEKDVRLLKNAVLWGIRDLLRKGKRRGRDIAPFAYFPPETQGRLVSIEPDPAAVAETNDEVRLLRQKILKLTHKLPFHDRVAMRANLLNGDVDAWKRSDTNKECFYKRRWYILKTLRERIKK